MALLSELVTAIASVEGLEESFVTGVARYLREAGLISQAGRGRGAAKMTYADAAALLIGVNATTLAKDAPEVVRDLLDFKWEDKRLEHGVLAEVIKERSDGLFDWVLQRSEHGYMGRGRLGTFLERLVYSAVPISGENSRLSSEVCSDEITFTITFHKPNMRVQFSYSYFWASEDDAEGEIYESGEFLPLNPRPQLPGDRREEVTITAKTILEVGRVLAS